MMAGIERVERPSDKPTCFQDRAVTVPVKSPYDGGSEVSLTPVVRSAGESVNALAHRHDVVGSERIELPPFALEAKILPLYDNPLNSSPGQIRTSVPRYPRNPTVCQRTANTGGRVRAWCD